MGEPRKYLVENGKVKCKPEFSDIKIEYVHNIPFVTFSWYEHVYEEQSTLPMSEVGKFNKPFGIREVVACDNIIRHFDKFSLVCDKQDSKLFVWSDRGILLLAEYISGFELLDTGVRYTDQNKQYVLLLNGDKIEKFEMPKYAHKFVDPRDFMTTDIGGWSSESLKQETEYLKAIIKNDLKAWCKPSAPKHTVTEGKISIIYRAMGVEESIDNAMTMMMLLRGRIDAISKNIESRENAEQQRQAIQQKIDSFCDVVDNTDFGI